MTTSKPACFGCAPAGCARSPWRTWFRNATITASVVSTKIASGNTLTIKDSGGKALLTYSTVPPYAMTPAPMTGTLWYLNSFVDSQGNFWSAGSANPISIQFADDGKVSGNAGCNSYSGSYTVTGNSISMSGFATTLMYCGEPGVMDLESSYLGVLPMMKVYKISGNELTLSDGVGKITLVYDTTK